MSGSQPFIGITISGPQENTSDEEKRKRDEKNKAKRATAAKELYDTEVTYVKSIMILTNGFMVPCKMQEILTKAEISEIFSNISQLLQFHKEFLKNLKERIDGWNDDTVIGDVVLTTAPYMKLYTAYSSNFEHALDSVQTFMKQYPRFAEFIENNLKSPSFGGLPLNAYLIMPIQRIPRYRMLLEVLVSATPPEHPDYKQLTEALEIVGDVANYINLHIAKEDNTRHLIRIQNTVPKQQILSPTRRFIMEASYPTNYFAMMKKAKNSRKEKSKTLSARLKVNSGRSEEQQEKRGVKRLSAASLHDLESDSSFVQANIYLFDDILVIQSAKDKTKSASLYLGTTWTQTQTDYGCVIELITLDITFILVTGSEAEQSEWVDALTLATNALLTANPKDKGLRDQFVLRRQKGTWRPVPAGTSNGSDEEEDEEEEKKTKSKRNSKGGLLIMTGMGGSPQARKGSLTRNISTTSILAQMRENAATRE